LRRRESPRRHSGKPTIEGGPKMSLLGVRIDLMMVVEKPGLASFDIGVVKGAR